MPKREFKYIILCMLTVGRLKTMDIVQDFYDKLAPQYDKLFPEESGFYQPVVIARKSA